MNASMESPSREQLMSAAEVVDTLHRNWHRTKEQLDAAHKEITTLQGRLLAEMKKVDDRDQRIFQIEEREHVSVVHRERIVAFIRVGLEAMVQAQREIDTLLLEAAQVRGGETLVGRDEINLAAQVGHADDKREQAEQVPPAEGESQAERLEQTPPKEVDRSIEARAIAVLGLLRGAGVTVEGGHEPYLVGNLFRYWPSTDNWRLVGGTRSGYGWRRLLAAVQLAQAKAGRDQSAA